MYAYITEHLLFTFSPESNNPHNLGVGSAVQYRNSDQYGVIKWIGTISGSKDLYAGVEMVRRYKILSEFVAFMFDDMFNDSLHIPSSCQLPPSPRYIYFLNICTYISTCIMYDAPLR